MKTKFILLCAATAALAACAKTEVTPEVLNQDAEITFLTAPVTKAEATRTFSTDKIFETAAFYDMNAFVYGSSTAETYIEKSPVKYFTDVWKVASSKDASATAVSYYWPKDGGMLTFFSWSLNDSDLSFACLPSPTVDITSADGVTITGFSTKSNDDFMVAEIQKDKIANTTPATYNNEGVPTLFKHKTCQFVVNVRTKADYTGGTLKQKFTVNEIDFIKLATDGSYKQNVDAWTPGTVSSDPVVFYKEATANAGQVVNYTTSTDNAEVVTPTGTYLYLPQTASTDQTFKVKYTVSRVAKDGTVKSTPYEATKSLKDLGFSTFEMGKKYIINLTFGLDEIFWDPAVEDWTVGKTVSAKVDNTVITVE